MKITPETKLKDIIEENYEIDKDRNSTFIQQGFERLENLIVSTQKEVLNIDELCTLTGISKSTIYKSTMNGTIPHFKKSKHLFFDRAEILDWLKENRGFNVKKISVMKPTGSKKEFTDQAVLALIGEVGQETILSMLKEWQGKKEITKKQAYELRNYIKSIIND